MAIIQASRPPGSGGGGGGGLTITGYRAQSFTQASNFVSGLTLALTSAPLAQNAVIADYNGQKIYPGTDFTVTGTTLTILFADPDVTTYDTPPKFNLQYPY